MTHDCDTFAASTMAAPAEPMLAWSECDEHSSEETYDDDVEQASRWRWVLVISAWSAAAVTLAVVIGMAYVSLAPRQQPPTAPQQQEVTSVLNDGTIAPFPPDQPRNT